MYDRSIRLPAAAYRNGDLVFQAISWHAQDVKIDEGEDTEEDKYLIKVFGVDKQGRTVSVSITDFTPFFYIKVPESWTDTHVKTFERYIHDHRKMYKISKSMMPMKLLHKKDFWGFTNFKEFKFVRLCFTNHAALRRVMYFLNDPITINSIGLQNHTFKQYESNIEPFLRFIHLSDVKPTGWMTIPQGKYRSTDILPTICQIDIETNWRQVKPHDSENTARFLIASFDLECASDTGDFPVPIDKKYKKVAADLYEAYHNVIIKKFPESQHIDVVYACLLKPFDLHPRNDSFALALERMNPVFPKEPPANTAQLQRMLKERALDDILALLAGRMANKKKREEIVEEINKILSNPNLGLPEVRGDAIIQVGTTFHYYGERECCERVIITNGSCKEIPNARVIACDSEEDLLMQWKKLMFDTNPDVITGYNIFGFDFSYMYDRAKDLGITQSFMRLGRFEEIGSKFEKKMLSSSALGDNELKYIDMHGRVLLDMMKVIQRDHKLDSYKLDAVASHFMKMNKNDVSPQDIFRLQKGSDDDRRIIAEYCLQDCALCNHLIMKLEILANNMGMSNVCLVPLSYIFMRGQGIKIFSLVLKQCKDENFVIPVVRPARRTKEEEEEIGEDSYEGAIVLEPKTGIYINEPITVFDYASLYPSSMISENLSHDMLVLDEHKGKFDNLPGVEYLDITYDIYEGVGDKKKKTGERKCRYAQLPNNEKGIIPRILQKLLTARKTTRKKIEWQQLTTTTGEIYRGIISDASPDAKKVKVADGPDVGKELTVPNASVASIEDCYNDFQKAVLDGLQLAYKITANSLYGQIGARTSPIYLKDIAACTTATGRKMIMMAKEFFEKNYEGTEIIYGDSVTGDTPLLLRYPDGHVDIQTIETITKDWVAYDNFRPWGVDLHEKQQSFINAEVWANGQWAKINRVIRHKTNKKLFRVNTFEGCVDVTEDHSLIDDKGQQIKPWECKVGETKLLHSFPSEFPEVEIKIETQGKEFTKSIGVLKTCTKCNESKDEIEFYTVTKDSKQRCSQCRLCIKKRDCERLGKPFNGVMTSKVLKYHVPSYSITKHEAWVWGIFFGDGSCGAYPNGNGKIKYSWAINNSNLKYLDIASKYLEGCEPNNVVKFKTLDTIKSSGVYKLVPTGSFKYMVEKYRNLFYDKDDYKKVPTQILNASYDVRLWFMRGYLAADGTKGDANDNKYKQQGINGGKWAFACKGKIGAQGLYYLMRSLGHINIRVYIQEYKENTYWISTLVDKRYIKKNANKLMKIQKLDDASTFVYDLETSCGKFHAGVGSMNLFNTDSVFIRFKSGDEQQNFKDNREALAFCKAIGLEGQGQFKKLIKPPHDLELEKFFDPFILLSKKRYVGNMYEPDLGKYKQKSMGIVLKRRDNAQIVKKIYGGAIDIILNQKDLQGSVDFVRQELEKLIQGETPLDDLIITKSLKANYADPTKIAHKVLAERMGERDPGNRPQVNDRIPFAYVAQPPPDPSIPKSKQPKILQGERIEHPAYIKEQNLQPDYGFYITNQIMKPVLQLYAIVADRLGLRTKEEYDEILRQLTTEHGESKAKDKLDQLRENDVKRYLFDPFLDRITPPKPPKPPSATALKKAAAAAARASIDAADGVAPPPKRRVTRKKAETTPDELSTDAQVQTSTNDEKPKRARRVVKKLPIDEPNIFENIPTPSTSQPHCIVAQEELSQDLADSIMKTKRVVKKKTATPSDPSQSDSVPEPKRRVVKRVIKPKESVPT